MLIKRIELNDFKNFNGTNEFNLSKINLISGINGAGKSTIALHSILFAIYGYSEVNIASLAPRLHANPNPYVQIELEHKGKNYVIRRTIPTSIFISIDGVELQLANNQLKQNELEKLFGNVEFFRKFRMVDIKDSINILEQGNQALRKTLVSFDDTIDIGKVRTNLMSKKNEREKLNKDIAVLYTHFPSDLRYKIISDGIINITGYFKVIEQEVRYNESLLYDLSNKKGRVESTKFALVKQKNSLMATAYCPTCNQALVIEKQKELLGDISTKIIEHNNQLTSIVDELSTQKEVVEHCKTNRAKIVTRLDRLKRFQHRLESRLKQKEYIYTTKDVEVLKKCVIELDGFTTFYITEKLKRLEPLINNLLNKLGFTVIFDVNDKNNFDITLINSKNGAEFKYRDLSNGQRLLVTVAFQLSLLMEKNESGLVVADEGFSSLDKNNLDLIFELFKNSDFQLISIIHRYDTTDMNVNKITL